MEAYNQQLCSAGHKHTPTADMHDSKTEGNQCCLSQTLTREHCWPAAAHSIKKEHENNSAHFTLAHKAIEKDPRIVLAGTQLPTAAVWQLQQLLDLLR